MNPNLSTSTTEAEISRFRRGYFSIAALFVLYDVAARYRYVNFTVAHGYVADHFLFTVDSAMGHAAFGLAAALALLGVARGGHFARFGAAAAIPLALVFLGDLNQLRPATIANRVNRDSCQLFVLLALFLVTPRGEREERAFLRTLKLAVVFPYVCAGLFKLVNGGSDWWTGHALQVGLLHWAVAGANPVSELLARSDLLCAALSAVVITGELLSPLAVFLPRLGVALMFFAAGFHLGTWWLLGPNFLQYFLPTFLVFLPPRFPRR